MSEQEHTGKVGPFENVQNLTGTTIIDISQPYKFTFPDGSESGYWNLTLSSEPKNEFCCPHCCKKVKIKLEAEV